MEGLEIGIFLVFICSLAYFLGWRFHSKEKYGLAIALLVLAGFLLRFYLSTDMFLHGWDERYHAVVAKHMMENPFRPMLYNNPVLDYDYANWTANHIWVHKQPLPLWSMAASMKIFGVNELALRLPSILISSCGIWLIYEIARFLYSRRTAFVAAFLFSINGLIVEITSGRIATDHIDVFFLFFVLLGVFFSVRFVQKEHWVYALLVGVAIGGAILSKWLPALIVLPIWGLLALHSKKFSWGKLFMYGGIILLAAFVVAAPWQFYIYSEFPIQAAHEAESNFKHLTEVLGNQTGPWYYFVYQIRINYGELIYLPIIFFAWKLFMEYKNAQTWAIMLWFLVPFAFFSFAQTKMQGYLLFTAPALFIMYGHFLEEVWQKTNQQAKYKWVSYLLTVAVVVLAVRYSVERVKPFEEVERSRAWAEDLKELGKDDLSNTVLFNYEHCMEAMFYTDLIAYPDPPTIDELKKVQGLGYSILVNDQGDGLPEHVFNASQVDIVELDDAEK